MLRDMFRKAKSAQIEIDRKTVLLYDRIPLPEDCKLTLRIEQSLSEWKQGLWIRDMGGRTAELRLTCAEQSGPSMVFWEHTCPQVVEIGVHAPKGHVHVYNHWDKGDGGSWSQLLGAGMLVEESEGGTRRRYRCNDGHPVPTFTHLVFSVEIA